MTNSSLGDDEGAGLGDPFAEIFARIATAEAPAPPPEVQSAESSVDEESSDSSDTVASEKAESEDAAETSTEIAPVKNPEALLNPSDDRAEVVDGEAAEVEITVEAESDNSENETGEEAAVEVIDATATTALEEISDTPAQSEETSAESVVDQEVAAVALQTNRRERGEKEPEVASLGQTSAESSETEIQAVASTTRKDVDPEGDQQESKERSAPVATEANQRVQRRRYSSGENNQNSQDDSASQESSTSGAASGENLNAGGRGQEGRSSLAGTSSGGIDISSMTPVSSTASSGAPIAALNSATTAVASKGGAPLSSSGASSGASSASSSASVSAKGSDAATPIDASSNQQRSTNTSSAKSEVTGTDTLSAVQRAKLVQRVSRGFQQLGPNGGQIRMRLSPDELGSIQLQLKLQNGELSGTMLTQTEAASQALREQLPQLRSSLENQGIRLDRMDIQTEAAASAQDADASGERFGDTSGQSGRGFEQRQQLAGQRQRSSWSDVRATPKGSSSSVPESGRSSANYATDGAVDLRA